MTIHLPPLFTMIGVGACALFVGWILFGVFMLWGFSSDWGPRLAVTVAPLAAIATAYFCFKLT